MRIFPAVDIQGGKAVRLRQGRKNEATVFSEDPVSMAEKWLDQGAQWLHIIDLDGAFEGASLNAGIVEKICRLGAKVQLGGGIRDEASVKIWLDAGAERLIVGTMALEDRENFKKLCLKYPGRIGTSLDGEGGRLKTRGWVADSGLDFLETLPLLEDAGASFIIYTDILRDGARSGLNLPILRQALAIARKPIIAAGGVAGMADVEALYKLKETGPLEGVIAGRALYENSLGLPEVLAWIAAREKEAGENYKSL